MAAAIWLFVSAGSYYTGLHPIVVLLGYVILLGEVTFTTNGVSEKYSLLGRFKIVVNVAIAVMTVMYIFEMLKG